MAHRLEVSAHRFIRAARLAPCACALCSTPLILFSPRIARLPSPLSRPLISSVFSSGVSSCPPRQGPPASPVEAEPYHLGTPAAKQSRNTGAGVPALFGDGLGAAGSYEDPTPPWRRDSEASEPRAASVQAARLGPARARAWAAWSPAEYRSYLCLRQCLL